MNSPSDYLGPPHQALPTAGGTVRSTAVRDASISAGLLVVATVFLIMSNAAFRFVPLLSDWTSLSNAASLAVALLTDVGLVVVVYLRGLTPKKKIAALITACVAMIVDVVTLALMLFVPMSGTVTTAVSWVSSFVAFLFVLAWGLARRRSPQWLVGLVPALIGSILVGWLFQSTWFWETLGDSAWWFVNPIIWFGVVGLGCLACWGFDAVAPTTPVGGWGAPMPYASAGPEFSHPTYRQAAPTNSMAIAALVSAFVLAPLGIVFGHISLSQLKRSGEDGKGLAIAGLVIGYVGTALILLFLVFFVIMMSALTSGIK